eukprot:CAMPEP_0202704210 /NCGR_PEP_ID=MMETSP1385-20130828/16930_1 /ASSEMBLY_ACC=CAM_ASM_000861 /TAXON_ID=933848 /ORGANISM="Elphidium margaritaceum" /LENGTH=314 /DNA_ID=CAMNT_0049362183 /DNA_START=23 /DNA_END=967 /DNA_ORIENTATION=-
MAEIGTPEPFNYAFTTTGTVILIGVLVYHAWSTRKHTVPAQSQNDAENAEAESKCGTYSSFISLLSASFMMLIFGLLYCISGLAESIQLENVGRTLVARKLFHNLLVLSYALFKLSLYIALCQRLIECYQDSPTLSYRRSFIYGWQLFVVLGTFAVTVAFLAETTVTVNRTIIPNEIILALLACDFFFCVVNLVLFLRPLCRLKSPEDTKLGRKVKAVMRKNALLASISILSTILAWVVVATIGGAIVIAQCTDVVVTCIATLLLFSRYQWIYDKMCCCCCSAAADAEVPDQMRSTEMMSGISHVGSATATEQI